MPTVRDAIPKARELATAEFTSLRLRLLKIAARVVETASRIRLAFAAACPEADLIRVARRAADEFTLPFCRRIIANSIAPATKEIGGQETALSHSNPDALTHATSARGLHSAV
jgi:hypothetical protein